MGKMKMAYDASKTAASPKKKKADGKEKANGEDGGPSSKKQKKVDSFFKSK